jgi:hypothetical protein
MGTGPRQLRLYEVEIVVSRCFKIVGLIVQRYFDIFEDVFEDVLSQQSKYRLFWDAKIEMEILEFF